MASGIVTLCPLDSNSYPSAPPSEIKNYGREVDLDEEIFFDLFETYLAIIQTNISDARKAERLKAK